MSIPVVKGLSFISRKIDGFSRKRSNIIALTLKIDGMG